MKALRRWVIARLEARTKGKDFREDQDQFHAALLLRVRAAPDPSVRALTAEMSQWRPSALRRFVRRGVSAQLEGMFDSALEEGLWDPYPAPAAATAARSLFADESSGFLRRWGEMEQLRQQKLEEKRIRHPGTSGGDAPAAPFQMAIARSTIPHKDAGLGVHVEGEAAAGTVMAVYPGLVTFPTQLSESVRAEMGLSAPRGGAGQLGVVSAARNGYLFGRYDGAIIDASMWEARAVHLRRTGAILAGNASGDGGAGIACFANPFGIGSYVNHPPPGTEPNVLAVGHSFVPDDMRAEHVAMVPNAHRTGGWLQGGGDAIHSVVLIATRRCVDEELFLDYRYNPALPVPLWYAHVDEAASRQRWAKKGK